MYRTPHEKWALFEKYTAEHFVPRATEPKSNLLNPPNVPLHQTLFSAGAIVYTKWFNAFFNQQVEGADVDQQVIQILSEKAEEIEVMFYGRAGWFSSNHLALRHYANWCIKEADGNFGLNTARKAKEYLQFCVDRWAPPAVLLQSSWQSAFKSYPY